MNRLPSILLLCCLAVSLSAQTVPDVTLAEDGFPTGQCTPEGAACDFARAFIELDTVKLLKVCLPRKNDSESVGKAYNDFIDQVVEGTTAERAAGEPHPQSPKEIGKVFTARPLSLQGSASYGYATHQYQEILFVDVGTYLNDGS